MHCGAVAVATAAASAVLVYSAEVNYLLLVSCIAVVAGFQSGTAIGHAYGAFGVFISAE